MAHLIEKLASQREKRTCLLPSLRYHSPLKDRIITRCVSGCSDTVKYATANQRPVSYRQWTEHHMREALSAIGVGMTVRKASIVYGIPRTTLNDHKLGKVRPGALPGRPTLLSTKEEEDLVNFLVESAAIGYGRTRRDVLNIVSRMAQQRGIKKAVTTGWWNKFICRHPLLSERTPASLSIARAKASSKECLDAYFDRLEEILQDTGLCENPSLLFNMDETGFAFDSTPSKTVDVRGTKNVLSVCSGSKAQITVLACVSAAGQALPPMIIWSKKTMAPDMATGELPGTIYGFSDNGWTNSHLFHKWFERIFLRYVPATRPILLLVDGHSSHYCPDTLALAAENGIIIFALPPNTTHLTQPLDKGVFGPFKTHWSRICHDFTITHPGQKVSEYNFCQLFSKAWLETMSVGTIVGGFQTTGIHPLNRDAIQLPGETKVIDKFLEPNLGFTLHKRYGLQNRVFSSSDISNIKESNTHPNSLVLAGVRQTTSEMIVKNKRIKPEDKVLASSDLPTPTKNAFGIKEGIHKTVQFAYAQCFVCGTEPVVTFKPCGHAVICAGCADRVKKCPTCKKQVKSFASLCLMCDEAHTLHPANPCGHLFCSECSKRMKSCFQCKTTLLRDFRVNSGERTEKSQTGSKTMLRKKPSQTSPSGGSDSSPEDSTLAAAKTRAVVIKKTKLRGCNRSPQECDEGTTKTVLRKKPSQTSPRGGSDSSPEDSTFPRTLGLSPHFSWETDSLWEVSTVGSPNIDGAVTCLTDIKTERGLRRRSSRPHIPSMRLQDSLFDISSFSLSNLEEGDNSTISLLSDSPLPYSPELTSWVADLSLTVADEKILLNGDWLSASHISAANKLMKCQFPSQNGLQDTCVLEQGRVWSSKPDNFVQIIYISPGHWACLSNKFSSAGQVDLYDSLHTRPNKDGAIVPQACLILHTSEPQLTIRVVNVGIQQGYDDCGLFSVAMAYDLCSGVDPSTKLYVQDQMRSHLHLCFNNKQMKPFPFCSTNIAMRVICNFTIEVFCTCRMPESEWMVCCDNCSEWYHEDCVTVPQEIRENENNDVFWQCPRCQAGSNSSPKDSTLAATRTRAVVIKKTKLRGCNRSPQECDEGTTKTVLRKKPSQTSPRGGTDSSPEDSTLAATGTQAVAIKLRKTKSRGCNQSPQECDKGTTKTVIRKKPSQTSPSGGSDSSPEHSTLVATRTRAVAIKLRKTRSRGCNQSPQECDEGTTKTVLRKKPSQTSPSGGFDSSPEDSTLAAAKTRAMVIKKTKLRGCNRSPQECDEGTTKTVLRKKPSQTSPRGGSDPSPEDSTLAATGTQAMAIKLRKTKSRGRNQSPQECDKGITKTVLRKKPSQTSPRGGSDPSPEHSTLVAAGTRPVAIKTKSRGCNPNPQERDKGTTKTKKPSQTSQFTGTLVQRKLRPR